jgi:hypothetical protein
MSARPGPCGGRSAMVVPTAISLTPIRHHSPPFTFRIRAYLARRIAAPLRLDRPTLRTGAFVAIARRLLLVPGLLGPASATRAACSITWGGSKSTSLRSMSSGSQIVPRIGLYAVLLILQPPDQVFCFTSTFVAPAAHSVPVREEYLYLCLRRP